MTLPAHVNQFRQPGGQRWPEVSVAGRPAAYYGGEMCGDAVAAVAVDWVTGTAPTPNEVRQASGVWKHQGLSFNTVERVLEAAFGVEATRRFTTAERLGEALEDPRVYVLLLVDDDAFPGCDPAFLGDHWVGVAGGLGKLGPLGRLLWPVMDPTCPQKGDTDGLPPGWNWERADTTVQAAIKWSSNPANDSIKGRCTYLVVRRPRPLAPPSDEVEKLKALLADARAERDDRQSAIDGALKQLERFT